MLLKDLSTIRINMHKTFFIALIELKTVRAVYSNTCKCKNGMKCGNFAESFKGSLFLVF